MSDTPQPTHPLIEFRETLAWQDITACVIVEPDLQSWMPNELAAGQVEQIHNDLEDGESAAALETLTPQIWIGAIDDESSLFASEGLFAPIHLHGYLEDDDSLLDFLRDIVAGVARRNPSAVFAVWGATRENEVARVAQVIAEAGLRVVILEPLCISKIMFTDLDEVGVEVGRQQLARRVLLDDDSGPWDTLFTDADDETDDDED